MRERDILNKLKTQAENATQRQMDLVKINENTKKNLEQEIQGYKVEAQKQAKMIYQLEKEREKYGAEASDATAKYLQVGTGWVGSPLPAGCMRKSWFAVARRRCIRQGLLLHTTQADRAPVCALSVAVARLTVQRKQYQQRPRETHGQKVRRVWTREEMRAGHRLRADEGAVRVDVGRHPSCLHLPEHRLRISQPPLSSSSAQRCSCCSGRRSPPSVARGMLTLRV